MWVLTLLNNGCSELILWCMHYPAASIYCKATKSFRLNRSNTWREEKWMHYAQTELVLGISLRGVYLCELWPNLLWICSWRHKLNNKRRVMTSANLHPNPNVQNLTMHFSQLQTTHFYTLFKILISPLFVLTLTFPNVSVMLHVVELPHVKKTISLQSLAVSNPQWHECHITALLNGPLVFSAYYMITLLLSTLHADTTHVCNSTMKTCICSAVVYRLKHSTSCVSTTVLSPQAFHVPLIKTDSQESTHMQPPSLTKWLKNVSRAWT